MADVKHNNRNKMRGTSPTRRRTRRKNGVATPSDGFSTSLQFEIRAATSINLSSEARALLSFIAWSFCFVLFYAFTGGIRSMQLSLSGRNVRVKCAHQSVDSTANQ